ncbi:hypothetical protein GH975_06410 [Litorivicinus lipolyticus]|uniref:Flagellar protein FliT n=1 Tax=Litorivicinus lipolyticus TaxID=418701 RepID=A0A5Q2Q814_9GAMM|nr:hypothetical protein [Litorivicinus lipolyticus]QGG80228.1 hypothetical protein GH975_06410 [Litorivicinus lipolyticus]
MSILNLTQAKRALVDMLICVDKNELDQAARHDSDIVRYLTGCDKSAPEIRQFVSDLMSAYERLQGQLSAAAIDARAETLRSTKAKKSVTAYQKASRY